MNFFRNLKKKEPFVIFFKTILTVIAGYFIKNGANPF